MKNAFYFLLIISITSVLTSGPAVDEVFNQFVELKTALGAQKEDIAVVIAQVRHSVELSSKALKGLLRVIIVQCDSARARFGAAVSSIERATREAQVSITNWRNTRKTARSDRKRAVAAIVQGKKEYERFEERLAKLVIEYKVVADDGNKKLGVIKVLRDIISDELLKRSGSFVQLTKFQKKLGELKEMLVSNTDSIYGPIVGVLLDLATERGFSDQGVLRKILQNLRQLKRSLV